MNQQVEHDAIDFWQDVLRLRPSWLEASKHLAQSYLTGGNSIKQDQEKYGQGKSEALTYFQKAVATSPGNAQARIAFVSTLIELGRFQEAFSAWEEIFAFRNEWQEVHIAIQNHFYHYGQFWAARAVMQATVKYLDNFAKKHELDQIGLRFLREYPTAIGHIGLLDNYYKMRVLGRGSSAEPVLLVHPKVSNAAYLDYWRDYFPRMISDPIAIDLLRPIVQYLEDRIAPVMDSSEEINADEDYLGSTRQGKVQDTWEAEGRAPVLRLKQSDFERGSARLRSLGVPEDAWFVGLHVREGKSNLRAGRDGTIDNYFKTIQAITRRGGWVVRMGDPSMTPLPPIPQVIDYAHSHLRVDWMDVFLWARCRFFVGTPSGPAWIPPTFGVPCVGTNWNAYLSWRWYQDDLFIPKLLWSENEKRHLKFSEVLGTAHGVAESVDYLNSVGVKLVDNTADEILEVVVEMLDKLDGKLKYSKEDEDLRQKLETMWASKSYKSNSRVGRAFLNRWANLI